MIYRNFKNAWWQVGLETLLLTAFISLKWLLDGNMGMVNEVDILPFARQHADPNWLPNDWYFNQPAGYRLPFIAVFGTMAAHWGFLATSIVGRLICYAWVTSGLIYLRHLLKLPSYLLFFALGLFLYANLDQGATTFEWMLKALESKAIAYGFVLWAIAFLLSARYRLMALMLGVATSFHTLVGGWAFLTALGWLLFHRKLPLQPLHRNGVVILIYGVASVFSIQPVLEELLMAKPEGRLTPSFIYVFIRSPHHLNPLSWHPGWWIKPVLYLAILAISYVVIRNTSPLKQTAEMREHRLGLAHFELISLIPFGLGLAIAPFDMQGKFLMYYPFRFGDIMLPLITCLLMSCALTCIWAGKPAERRLRLTCISLLAIACVWQASTFQLQIQAIQQFPGEEQVVDAPMEKLFTWVRENTPQDAVFIAPPVDLVSFNWIAERATIANFKQIPPSASGVVEWIERLSDLSGNVDPWANLSRTKDQRDLIQDRLRTGYEHLTVRQVKALMQKYQAQYLVTLRSHRLNLPKLYQNSRYIVYGDRPI
jgi:hypothetical protein